MPGGSNSSKVIPVRLPNDVIETLERRIKKGKGSSQGLSQYLRDRITYDVRRKHGKP